MRKEVEMDSREKLGGIPIYTAEYICRVTPANIFSKKYFPLHFDSGNQTKFIDP